MKHFDCVVVGGGMVGAASALSLAQLGLQVALVEQQEAKSFDKEQALDLRVSAISLASEQLLEQLEAWQQVIQWRACAYKRLAVWELDPSYTEFSAAEIEQTHLGHIVENRLIQLSLWQQINQHENIELFCPESLVDFEQISEQSLDEVKVQLSNHTITTKLLIAADGASSQVRQLANIGTTGWDYQQSAMLINVETALPQQDITWQQFTPSGPRSFLPLCSLKEEGQGSLVWYDSPRRIKQLCTMTKPHLRTEILNHFPKELGDIEVLQFGSFPLTRRHAQSYSNRGCVLVGDSAHTINPLAGQGVNLGFKDVAALLDISKEKGELTQSVARRYEVMRRSDNLMMQSGMDFFYKTFSNDIGPLKFVRNAALKLAENSGPIKAQVLKYALGL